ncbi:MAG: hypothetical protein JWP89_3051 [Schlesneria sp.]|nr:hypothetical protein [Schlesneria sp.]
MPADWQIEHWPVCGFHVFLSHVAEDRDTLILPVLEKLRTHRVISWIDQADYPTGRDSHEALRESILKCRHIIYFITPSLIKQGRGWTAIESAYGDIIQNQLSVPSAALIQFELPLFFMPVSNPKLGRTAWRRLTDRGAFYRVGRSSNPVSQVDWAVQEIAKFIQREELQAEAIDGRLQSDESLRERCKRDQNFANRLLAVTPARLR